MEQLVARLAHNPKVVGSSPAPATKVRVSVRVSVWTLTKVRVSVRVGVCGRSITPATKVRVSVWTLTKVRVSVRVGVCGRSI